MLAVVPRSPVEAHDTDVDARPARPTVRLRLKTPLPAREPSQKINPLADGPVLAGAPISAEESLCAGQLAAVRVREARVKVQATLNQKKAEAAAPSIEPPPPPTMVPDVRIAFLRSTDRSQRVARYGADGFVVRGTATGGNAPRPGAPRPMISVGIDGLIFSVPVEAGDSAYQAFQRLVDRLGRAFEVEIVEAREDLCALRLVASR